MQTDNLKEKSKLDKAIDGTVMPKANIYSNTFNNL